MFCFQKEVNFLGEIVNDKGVMTTPEKNKTMTNVEQLESFIGFINYNRDHVKRFAEIIEPLHKKSEYKWTDQHQDAFKS